MVAGDLAGACEMSGVNSKVGISLGGCSAAATLAKKQPNMKSVALGSSEFILVIPEPLVLGLRR